MWPTAKYAKIKTSIQHDILKVRIIMEHICEYRIMHRLMTKIDIYLFITLEAPSFPWRKTGALRFMSLCSKWVIYKFVVFHSFLEKIVSINFFTRLIY